MRKLLSFFALLMLVSGANAAHITVLSATLDGAQSGTGVDGKGAATMTYNSDTGEFQWFVAWQGLTGPATAAHFHGPAEPGENAGVEVGFDHTSNPSVGSTIITPGQAGDLLAGLWYINIHTGAFPGGEIRGQVLAISPNPVPLPAAAWLLLSGCGILLANGRRRKR